MTTPITFKIGKVFFDDHEYRELMQDEYDTKETKTNYTVTMSERDFCDLIEDAWFYADEPDYGTSLRAGARSVLKAMQKQFTYDQVHQMMTANGYQRTMRELRAW
jgi:hypothetical protein